MNYDCPTEAIGSDASPSSPNPSPTDRRPEGSGSTAFRREMRAAGADGLVRALLQYAAAPPCRRANRAAELHWSTVDDRELRHVINTGLAPLLWQMAQEVGTPPPPAWHDTLLAADLTARVVYGNMCDATVDIIDACQENGVRVTLLKGVSVGDQHYPAAHLRPMGDVDLLVAKRDRGWVEAMMLRRGYTRMAGFHAEDGDPHDTPLFQPELRVWVEIHTGLFPEGDLLRRNRLFAPSWLALQTVASTFRGRPVGRFSEELQLAYIASYWIRDLSNNGMHASFVKPLLDAVHLLEASGPLLDWDGMLEWLDNDLAAASLSVLLSFLSTRGFCAVPERILARLASAQDIVGATELRIVGAMIDRSLVAGRPFLGSFGERHPMIAITVLKSLLAKGSHAGKLLSLPWAMVFPPWIAQRYTLRYQRDRLRRLLLGSN